MTEPMESGKYTPGAQTAGIVKWLRYLLIIQVIGLAVTVLGAVGSLSLVAWLGRGVTLATAVVLFQLAAGNPRYKTAALFQVVVLVCGIIAVLSGSLLVSLLNLVSGVSQIVAEYQEYTGHGELIEKKDGKLAGRWRALFIWKVVIELFGGVLAVRPAAPARAGAAAAPPRITDVLIDGSPAAGIDGVARLLAGVPDAGRIEIQGEEEGRTSVLLHAGTEDLYRLCRDIFLACAENNAVLLELTPRRASLEDVFLELNAGQPEAPAADEDTEKDKEARS